MTKSASPQRTAPKQARCMQLIEANIDVLAQKGFSSLTISDVAKRAGLSHGIVNFHFTSKDELMRATIMEMERRYCGLMERALLATKGDPVASIRAMAEVEFCDELIEERIIRAWAAFRSEASDLYRATCEKSDRRFYKVLVGHCTKLDAPEAAVKAGIIDATLRGLILHKLQRTKNVREARRISMACLHAVFPAHFPPVQSAVSAIENRAATPRKSQRVIGEKTNRTNSKAKRKQPS
jgi:TetR/AcrR family transcriptional regulator, transcriptional repressor of bet genes